MDLLTLADFNSVAAHGGFGRASRAIGQSKTTLSRRVRELEDALGVRLIERGPSAFRLTEEGAALHARTAGLLDDVAEAAQAIAGGFSHPRGRLKISAPVLFADVFMGKIAAAFAARFPEVELDVTADDRTADPIAEGFDVVVRVNPRLQSDLVGRCFLRDQTLVVASSSLRRPARRRGTALALSVPAVVLTALPETSIWRTSENSRQLTLQPRPVLRLSSFLMVREAVRAGAGAALLPRSIVEKDLAAGRLKSWGIVSDRNVELWVLHTSRRLVSPKVAAFVQHLCDSFQPI